MAPLDYCQKAEALLSGLVAGNIIHNNGESYIIMAKLFIVLLIEYMSNIRSSILVVCP